MRKRSLYYIISVCLLSTVLLFFIFFHKEKEIKRLPIIAIANYGPHVTLETSISSLKEELRRQGFIEHETIEYKISDVGFDTSLIPQMVTKLKNSKPTVIVSLSTPVAQFTKKAVKNIPIIYCVVTDPIEAQLIKKPYESYENITGVSDQQDLRLLLNFVKKIIPNSKTVGILYSTSEMNDLSLIKMMREAGVSAGINVMAVPVDQPRDIPFAMKQFKGKVDFIYVGSSGVILPTLPVIVAESNKMGLPVFNVGAYEVKEGLVLGSFGVDYNKIGVNVARIVVQILKGKDVADITPLYPDFDDHKGFINYKKAKELGLELPDNIDNVTIVE